MFPVDHTVCNHAGQQRLNSGQHSNGKCIWNCILHSCKAQRRKMEAWQCIADRIQISDGRSLQRKEFYHQDSCDHSQQRTRNLFENIRRNDQDCKTYHANNHCRQIDSAAIFNKSVKLFHGLNGFYSVRISHAKEIFELTDHDGHSNSSCKSGGDGVRNKTDQCTKMAQSHQNQKDSCQDRRDHQSIQTIFRNNTSYDRRKCSCRSRNLYAAATQSRDHKPCHNCGENTCLRTDT